VGRIFNELKAPRFAEFIKTYLAEDVEFSSVGPEFLVALVLEQELQHPEWSYEKKERLWSAGINRGALAANVPVIRVVNPVGSGLLVTVRRIALSTAGASIRLQVGPTTTITDLATIVNGVPSDLRYAAANFAKVRLTAGDLGAATFTNVWYDQLHNTAAPLVVPFEITLPPGTGFECSTPSVNNSLFAAISGTERIAKAEELAAG
jgi:hypothetical protein